MKEIKEEVQGKPFMKIEQLENDIKQLEEEESSLVDQVIALKAELESHEKLIVKKEKTIAELHAWSTKLEAEHVKKDELLQSLHKTIADLHGVLVSTK